MHTTPPPFPDREELRSAIQTEYRAVATKPDAGFHFHTGRPLTRILGYEQEWLDDVPEDVISSFAGTGSPFRIGELSEGERVLDLGCGAGLDSFIAAKQVGRSGEVKGIDMTPEMLEKARTAVAGSDLPQLSFHEGYVEEIPAPDGWADVVISNGVVNLSPDKPALYQEIHRVLRPGGRLQIADIMVSKPVPEGAMRNIDLWTG